MAIFSDDLGMVIDVEFYRVPETRPVVPYLTPFGSRDWIFPEDQPILGEVQGTRSYSGNPSGDDLSGAGLCGSRLQWENGCSILDPLRPINPTTGQPCCCGPGALPFNPETIGEIEAETMQFPTVYGCESPHLVPVHWIDPVNNWHDLFEAWDPLWFGLLPLGWTTYSTLCRWERPAGTIPFGAVKWFLRYNHPIPGWQWFLGTNAASYDSILRYEGTEPWNQYGPNTLNKVTDITGVMPATITIEPFNPG